MLSLEQQQTIENSIWVVNTALKKQGLQADEDLRQSAILYLCKCILRFDPNRNIKWTTYAYKNIALYIKRVHKKQMHKQSFLLDDDIMDLGADLVDNSYFEDGHCEVESILQVCEPIEKKILQLKLEGYKNYEIETLIKCNQNQFNGYMKSIKNKAQELEL